jgi:4-hydroxy-2-oxoheptanedioate aldolase
MQTPVNLFKQHLLQGRTQIGLWVTLANANSAEIVATAGFDWLLLDAEHAPNDIPLLLSQLHAVALFPHSHPIVRVPVGDVSVIKQVMDIGAQTILVPMVDTPEQALLMARAMRYPMPGDREGMGGLRGMAGGRVSRWGLYPRYVHEANDQACLLVQIETTLALKNLDAIAATPGVDGVFIGPTDLSASMGHPGNPGHPAVHKAISDAIARIRRAGKSPGTIAVQETQAHQWLDAGAQFVAVGLDAMLLANAARELRRKFDDAPKSVR